MQYFCSKCDKRIDKKDKVCYFCGTKLDKKLTKKKVTRKTDKLRNINEIEIVSNKKRRLWLLIPIVTIGAIISFAIFIFIVLVIIGISSSSNEESNDNIAIDENVYEEKVYNEKNYNNSIDISDFRKGKEFYDDEDYQNALIYFDKAIIKDPEIANIYFYKAETLSYLNEHQSAIENYNKCISIDSDYTESYIGLTITLYALENYDDALLSINKAIDLNMTNHLSFYLRGRIYMELEKPKVAIDDFDKSISINPTFYETYNYKASIHNNNGEYNLALEAAIKSVELEKNNAKGYGVLGDTYYHLEEYEKAIEATDKALFLLPDNENLLLIREVSSIKLKENGINNEEGETLYNRAMDFYQEDDYVNAIVFFNKAEEAKYIDFYLYLFREFPTMKLVNIKKH